VASGVDQNGASSKQELARDALLELVGSLEIGVAIPPERRLATQLGVSRPTLRMAIDELVREGLLLRRHGSGTYVAEPKIALPLTITSFSEDMRQRGMRPASRVLSFEEQSAGAKLGARLRVSPADRVWVIRRLRLADSEPMALEVLHVPQGIAPDLARRDLEQSFYELLAQRYGTVVVAGTQTIEPTVTNEEEAEVLGVPVHAPAFLFERTSTCEQGKVVEFVRSIYRGDRYRLVTELRPALGSR
jgi:GntR family transcriptional regulator